MAKILVVDDDRFTRLAVEKYLKSLGHEVVTASNGFDGLELVKTENPELVILDMMMPKMDGMGFLRELREGELGSDVPVIALTAMAHKEFVVNALKYGVKDYVTKPFNPNTLLLKVQKVVQSLSATTEA